MWQLGQRLISGGALVILAPVLAVLAIAVRLDSKGPILHRASRMGRGGAPITVHKFRSMRASSGMLGPAITYRGDPRVTRVGAALRATHLDELPQLWDVLRGAMSLVGPRPEAPEFVDMSDPRWREILTVRPGITGQTQLAFVDEAQLLSGADPAMQYRTEVLPRKLESDLEYVRHQSPSKDMRILVQTVRVLLSRG